MWWIAHIIFSQLILCCSNFFFFLTKICKQSIKKIPERKSSNQTTKHSICKANWTVESTSQTRDMGTQEIKMKVKKSMPALHLQEEKNRKPHLGQVVEKARFLQEANWCWYGLKDHDSLVNLFWVKIEIVISI